MRAKFVAAQPLQGGNSYGTSSENKSLSQRQKLEEAILNLATALGASDVERVDLGGRVGWLYRVAPQPLQSASNTIVSLSRRLLESAGR